jgi:hypothetical protein
MDAAAEASTETRLRFILVLPEGCGAPIGDDGEVRTRRREFAS